MPDTDTNLAADSGLTPIPAEQVVSNNQPVTTNNPITASGGGAQNNNPVNTDNANSDGIAEPVPSTAEGSAPPQSDSSTSSSASQPLASTGKRTIAIPKEDIEKFGISEEWITRDPALIELILTTESMKDEERKYWFQLIPVMTEDQITKLRGILQNEKNQLAKLDTKYENEVQKLNDTHLGEWRGEETAEKMQEIEKREAKYEEKEEDTEKNILDQIDNL